MDHAHAFVEYHLECTIDDMHSAISEFIDLATNLKCSGRLRTCAVRWPLEYLLRFEVTMYPNAGLQVHR